jgi:hypothetical protein
MFNNNKAYQGSKRKARKAAYEARQIKRQNSQRRREYFNQFKECADIERLAEAMGIKLK